ncbi:hypothetical protein ACTA71_008656 [Dictyostelium dimigraforme]
MGPVKFFEDLENVFQIYEVETTENKIRTIKMKILDHCTCVGRIEYNMDMKQVQEIVTNNYDSVGRLQYYKDLIKGAARKATKKGEGILDYVSIFDANHKQLYSGLSPNALIKEFTFYLPGDIVIKIGKLVDKDTAGEIYRDHCGLNSRNSCSSRRSPEEFRLITEEAVGECIDYSSTPFFAKDKNGKTGFFINYRDAFPMPNADDTPERTKNARWFSKVNSQYYMIRRSLINFKNYNTTDKEFLALTNVL